MNATPTPSAPKTLEELKAEALRLVSAACGAWSNVVAHEGYTLAKANKAATAEAELRSAIEALAARGAQPLVQPGQVDEDDEPVATRGSEAIINAWNALPNELRLSPYMTRLFEAVKTCRDVTATQADNAASVSPVSRDGADTERLDWLESQQQTTEIFTFPSVDAAYKPIRRWCIGKAPAATGLREAIDAARAGDGAQHG